MNDSQTYVFNQYYIDLLKKIKNAAKQKKDSSKPARDCLRALKKNYASMDKLEPSYIQVLQHEFWEAYSKLEDPLTLSEPSFHLFTDMPLSWIENVLDDAYTLHHYLMIFNLFRQENLPVDTIVEVLKHVFTSEFEEKVKSIESENLQQELRKIKKLHSTRTNNLLENELKGLESTTLVKLAKEIMTDINVEELQNTLQNDQLDILSSLQNPDSGFGKLVSSVSTKMLSKLASGELQQDKLLEEAMGLATKLPGMLPGDLGKSMGGLGSMLNQFQKMGMNPESFMKNMSGAQRNAAGARMKSASRKHKMSERLKKKLQEKAEGA